MKLIPGYLAAVCLLLIIIAQSIFIPTFHIMPYFRWHYEHRQIPESIGVEKEELMRVTQELLDYMRGRRDDIYTIYAEVWGQERQFFSDIEIRHMIDVRELYDVGFIIRNFSILMFIFLILFMAFCKIPIFATLARCSREVIAAFLILLVILIGVIVIDFDRAFIVFHLLFFDNDYWILDPGVDLLINMVPQTFFVEISIFIGALLLLFCVAVIVASTLYLKSAIPRRR